ncbi:MAG: N(4)-(beta-N-acetylglucosaminyl)-L-asparaginase [Thermoguttaceae bacterium]|nr:N(4)-(beta-N-acetylglucosaminyl)-L-asparaginase [Thermoguttaceae bacterium]MDW8078980.1 N(4)-(beta-N-acetylglucosaminyl)-L-asparaginase [Thermoguttaceae bacterium]
MGIWEPIVLGTWKFGAKATAAAWKVLVEEGGSALDAVVAGCQAVEADPEVTSVGYGGLPDAIGQVSLDAAVMLSPEKSAGVAFVRQFAHPIQLARLVLEHSWHKLLVGEGAERFARQFGCKEQDLRTPRGLAAWRRWLAEQHQSEGGRASTGPASFLSKEHSALVPPATMGSKGQPQPTDELGPTEDALPADSLSTTSGGHQAALPHDTIGVLARDSSGQIAAGCSTSGLAFKLPGRVGDSPIVGHGLYVDPHVGAAVATGNGELMMGVCGTFLAVECLRRGATAEEAAAEVIRRIVGSFSNLENKQAAIIVLSATGAWGAAALRPGFQVALRSPGEERLLEPQFVYFAER